MGWLIFFAAWILFLWLYRYSERNRQRRMQAIREDRNSDYGVIKGEFDASMESFNASQDFAARLAHIDRAIDCLRRMEEILPGKEHASAQLPQLLSLKQALTLSDVKAQYEAAMRKARAATLLVAKVNHATAAQAILIEGLKLGLEEKTLAREIAEANDFVNKIQCDEYLAKARKEEKKGNLKGAVDQYQVALYFMKMTSTGGEGQDASVREIEERIQRLYE